MKWKEFVRAYFNFSRRDRIGISVLLAMIALVYLSPGFFTGSSKQANVDTSWIEAATRLKNAEIQKPEIRSEKDNWEEPYSHRDEGVGEIKGGIETEPFNFDPNTLSTVGWARLGIKERTFQTIRNFISKGGKFKSADDLSKIYGLRKEDYERLKPFVRISQETEFNEQRNMNSKNEFSKVKYNPIKAIDINLADTSEFIALPGIGSKLAARIVLFREKLGGFYSIEQVGETFGLADSVFQKIRPYFLLGNTPVKSININTSTFEELKSHPYIRSAIAKSFIAYRNEHGPFLKIEDIKKVMVITDEIYGKVVPYLVK